MLTGLTLLALGLTMALSWPAIDVNAEHVLPLAALARRLPARRDDRPVSPATIHRWRLPGVRGVRLECVRIGGIWHTSLEAYQRWVDRLTASADPTSGPPAQANARSHRSSRQDDVERLPDRVEPRPGTS